MARRKTKREEAKERHNLTATAIGFLLLLVVVEFDLVREVIVHLDFCLLKKRILGNCLECLLNIDCFLCAGLKVWYVVFAVAPCLCSFCRNLGRQTEFTDESPVAKISLTYQSIPLTRSSPNQHRCSQTSTIPSLRQSQVAMGRMIKMNSHKTAWWSQQLLIVQTPLCCQDTPYIRTRTHKLYCRRRLQRHNPAVSLHCTMVR